MQYDPDFSVVVEGQNNNGDGSNSTLLLEILLPVLLGLALIFVVGVILALLGLGIYVRWYRLRGHAKAVNL